MYWAKTSDALLATTDGHAAPVMARIKDIMEKMGFAVFGTIVDQEWRDPQDISSVEEQVCIILWDMPEWSRSLTRRCPTMAMEFPMRLVLWEEGGQVQIVCSLPSLRRHHLAHRTFAGDPDICRLEKRIMELFQMVLS